MTVRMPQGRPTPPVKPSRLVPPAKSEALLQDQKLNELLGPLYDWAGVIGRYVEKLGVHSADAFNAEPGPHAQTHMAGTDSVFGTQEPSAITLGDHEGAIGDRALGAAPIDHVHDDTALAALAGFEFDAFGAVVADTQARRLLELLWIELLSIEEMLRSRRDRVR